jgi:hypothetical protein
MFLSAEARNAQDRTVTIIAHSETCAPGGSPSFIEG